MRPRRSPLGALAYQTVWVVSVTFVVWFALIKHYSANRVSAFILPHPAVRRRRRPSGAGRAADAGLRRRGGAGRRRAGVGQPGEIMRYFTEKTPLFRLR